MIGQKFKKFYHPYFVNTDLSVTPVRAATFEQASHCELLSEFNWEHVDDLPLVELVKKHILELPPNLTFITAGPENDIIDRHFRDIFLKYRNDIQFIKPDRDITEEFVLTSAEKYFCHHPFSSHVLYTMKRLVSEGKPCGSLGRFIQAKKILNNWIVKEEYLTVPTYLFSLEHSDLVVPDFTLPFTRAFIKNLRLPNCRFDTHFCGVTLLLSLLTGIERDIFLKSAHFVEGDDWNWYSQLVNRNWQDPSYYQLDKFI